MCGGGRNAALGPASAWTAACVAVRYDLDGDNDDDGGGGGGAGGGAATAMALMCRGGAGDIDCTGYSTIGTAQCVDGGYQ